MVLRHLLKRAIERRAASEPLIDDCPQGILIACLCVITLQLFRSSIKQVSATLWRLHTCAKRSGSQAKVGNPHGLSRTQQQAFWFDIAMDDTMLMRVSKGVSDLPNILNDGCDWQFFAGLVFLAQGLSSDMFQSKIGRIVVHAVIHDMHNIRVLQIRKMPRLFLKDFEFFLTQRRVHDMQGDTPAFGPMLGQMVLDHSISPQRAYRAEIVYLSPWGLHMRYIWER